MAGRISQTVTPVSSTPATGRVARFKPTLQQTVDKFAVPNAPMTKKPLPGTNLSAPVERPTSPLGRLLKKTLPEKISTPVIKTAQKVRDFLAPTQSQQMKYAFDEDNTRTLAQIKARAEEMDKEQMIIRKSDGSGYSVDGDTGTVASIKRVVGRSLMDIAKSRSSREIAEIVRKELPNMGDRQVVKMADILRDVTDPKQVSTILEQTRFATTPKEIVTGRITRTPEVATQTPELFPTVTPTQKTPAVGRIARSVEPEPQAVVTPGSVTSTPQSSTRSQNLLSSGFSEPSSLSKTIDEGTPVVSSPDQLTRKMSPSSSFKNFNTIDDYITTNLKIAQGNKAAFDESIGRATGHSIESRVKLPDTLRNKVEYEISKGRDPSEVRDLLAGRVVVPESDVLDTIENLKKAFKINEARSINYFNNPSPWGYRGVNLALENPAGGLLEFQLHTPKTKAIDSAVHDIYEKWRRKDRSTFTTEQLKEFEADQRRANERADEIWNGEDDAELLSGKYSEGVQAIPVKEVTAEVTSKVEPKKTVNTKLEKRAAEARSFDDFYKRTGITREALDATAKSKGYIDAVDFYDANKSPEAETGSYELAAEQWAGDEFVLRRSLTEEEKVTSNLREIFADLKGIDLEGIQTFTTEDLKQWEDHYSFVIDSLIDDPARELVKYVSKTTGRLPEVTGKDTMQSLKGGLNTKTIKNSEFGKRGDEIIQEIFGYQRQLTREDAQSLVEAYIKRRDEAKEIFEKVQEIRKSVRTAKALDNFVGENQKKLAKELLQSSKALTKLVQAAERAGFRKGIEQGTRKYASLVSELKDRRARLNAVQEVFNLTDAEMKKVVGSKDPRFMSPDEFKHFLAGVNRGAEALNTLSREKAIIRALIDENGLNKTENLQKALQLPKLDKMNLGQLKQFGDILAKIGPGETFLGPRMIQTAANSDLGKIRTVQEGINAVLKQTNWGDFKGGVTGSELDEWMRVPTLAEKSPMHRFFITKFAAKQAEMITRKNDLEHQLNRLAKTARKSRKRGVWDFVTPQDKLVSQWLQPFTIDYSTGKRIVTPNPAIRTQAAAKMTKEELEYANFLQDFFRKYYNYSLQDETQRWTLGGVRGSQFEDMYMPHMTPGALERMRNDGIWQGLKTMFSSIDNQKTKVDFNANGDRGEVLGMEKWLNRSVTREGAGIDKNTGKELYTLNAAKTALSYFDAFEKKILLDSSTPEIKMLEFLFGQRYQTPKSISNPEGTEKIHSELTRQLNQWINNQKGQRIKFGWSQGSKVEGFIDASSLLLSIWQIGGNITTQLASAGGAQLFTLSGAGFKGWGLGQIRSKTSHGKEIARKYSGIITENPYLKIGNQLNDLGQTLTSGLFYVMAELSYVSQRQMLLGLLTKEEFVTGVISQARQGEIALRIGKFHDMPKFRSVVGATSAMKVIAPYVGWAIPVFQTSTKNFTALISKAEKIGKDNPGALKELFQSEEFKTQLSLILTGLSAYVVGQQLIAPEDDGDTLATLRRKIARELGSNIQAMTLVGVIQNNRNLDMLKQMAAIAYQLAALIVDPAAARYSEDGEGHKEGDLKVGDSVKKLLTPAAIKPFLPEKETEITPIEDVKKKLKADIESGELTVAAAKKIYIKELASIKERETKKRYALSKEEYTADLRTRLETKEITMEDAKKEFQGYLKQEKEFAPEKFEGSKDADFIGKVVIAAKAMGTDPHTAFQAIFTDEKIRRMDNGEIILYRGKATDTAGQRDFSVSERKARGASEDLILDHTVPLQLGGDNGEDNLKLVDKIEWEKYTPVENHLGKLLRDNKITAKKAQQLIKAFKNNEITAEQVYGSAESD